MSDMIMKKPLFNPEGDIDVRNRSLINFDTTNINDFNNMKYEWVSDWYRQAMNNFWIRAIIQSFCLRRELHMIRF